MDETLEEYQKLKAKYEKLKDKHKAVLKNYDSDIKHIMDLEDEILSINTNTIENNKRFNNN
jgi:hypothetical protein